MIRNVSYVTTPWANVVWLYLAVQRLVAVIPRLTSLPVFEQEGKRSAALLEEGRDDESDQSEDDARPPPSRGAAWVDEDDELEEE